MGGGFGGEGRGQDVGQGGCERKIEVIVKMQKTGGGGWGSQVVRAGWVGAARM